MFGIAGFNEFSSKFGYSALDSCLTVRLWCDIWDWNIELTSVSSLEIRPKNMCDIVFDKVKGRGSEQNDWLCSSSRPKGFYKKCLPRNY